MSASPQQQQQPDGDGQSSEVPQSDGQDGQRTLLIGVQVPDNAGRRRWAARHRPQDEQQPPATGETGQLMPHLGALAASVSPQDAELADPSARVQFLLGVTADDDEASEDQLRPLFCQLNELDCRLEDPVWNETARWIKFVELVEEGGQRWSKPHVATLNLQSLFELRNIVCAGEVLLDCDAQNMESVAAAVCDSLVAAGKLSAEQGPAVKELLLRKNWNLHEKRMNRNTSFLGLRGLGKKLSSRDLERDGQQSSTSPKRNRSAAGGLSELDAEQAAGSQKFDQSFRRKVPAGAETANILVGSSPLLQATVAVFIRLRSAVQLPEITEVPVASRFVFVMLQPQAGAEASKEIGKCMGTLMSDGVFREVAYASREKTDLLAGFDEFMKFCIVLPPNEWDPSIRIEPPKAVPSQESRKKPPALALPTATAAVPSGDVTPTSEKPPQSPASPGPASPPDEESHFDMSLERTGRLFGGLTNDVKRKAPFFLSDFKDGVSVQTAGAFFFIYFACLTPIITFGGLLTDATEGYLGAMESILSGAICGISFSLFAGQPLTILGSTGPVLVFETIVYKMCKEWQWDYLGLRFWIGMWMMLILLLFVAFDLSALVKYITRFTEESFAALISMIFIVEAIKKLLSIVKDYPVNSDWYPTYAPDANCSCELAVDASERLPLQPGKRFLVPHYQLPGANGSRQYFVNFSALPYWDWDSPKNQKICVTNQGEWVGSGCGDYAVPDVFFFSVLLFLGTFTIGYGLKAMRTSKFFPNFVRSIISDFAVMLAIVSMSLLDLLMGLQTPKLRVPEEFSPTLGYDTRGWIAWPFGPRGQNPWYSALFAILPALLATILIFMDQQITAVIVNRKENKLRKGLGYHLDLLIVALLIGSNSLLGIPWFVAATVLSINHVMALKIESESAAPGERPQFMGCRENRLTGTTVFLLIGLSVFLTPVLKHIPMPVLYGVFLYMGVSSLRGVQLVQRVMLFLMPQKYQPDYQFLRHVKIGQVHKFTIIQVSCFVMLWVVKTVKQISILFPIMVLAMCFVRKALDWVFTQQELRWLDTVMPELTLRPMEQQPDEVELTDGQVAEKRQQYAGSPAEAATLLTPDIVVQPPSRKTSPA